MTVAPTADPAGTAVTIDGSSVVTKHTSPSTAIKIVEVGWYRASGTNAANWEIGLYADSGGAAGSRLFVDATNSSGSNGWLAVAVDWTITGSTAYWLGLQMDAHSGSSTVDSEASGGAGSDLLTAQTALNDPYGGGAVADADGMYAIYAVWQAASTDHTAGPNDSLSVSDARSLGQGKAQADTLALAADSVVLDWTLADRWDDGPVGISDSLSLARGQAVADTVSLTDALALTRGLLVTDSLTLTDEATPVLGGGVDHTATPEDSVALADAVAVGQGEGIADTVALADAQAHSRGLAIADTEALDDSLSRTVVAARAVDDTVAVTDAQAHARGLSVADTVSLADEATPDISTGSTPHTVDIDDAVALADQLAASKGYAVTIPDSLLVADLFARAATYARVQADTLELVDVLGRTTVTLRTVADLVAITDLVETEVNLVTLLDAIVTGRVGNTTNGGVGVGEGHGRVADTVAGLIPEEVTA